MEAIVLAAGLGTRMMTSRPKVLVEVEGIPIIKRVINALNNKYTLRKIVVVGENYSEIQNIISGNITYAFQMKPLGTLDAYVQALPYVSTKEVIVLPCDIPYIDKVLLEDIISYYYRNNIRNLLIGMNVLNPHSYGRIINDNGNIKIIEDKHCTEEQKKIHKVNSGIYIFNVEDIYQYLSSFTFDKEVKEFYITDFINFLADQKQLSTLIFPETYKLKGVNDIGSLNNLIKEKQNESTYKKII